MSRVVKSQMAVAGDSVTITRRPTKEQWIVNAVLTSRDGSLTAEVGGVEYQISAHILVEKGELYHPKVGDRVLWNGKLFMMINAVDSPNDGAVSCDLVLTQK